MALLGVALVVPALRPASFETVAAGAAIPPVAGGALATLGAAMLRTAAFRTPRALVLPRLTALAAATGTARPVLRTLVGLSLIHI